MSTGLIGLMTSWVKGGDPKALPHVKVWAADNGKFASTTTFDLDKYLGWLSRVSIYKDKCLFATAPDVVADARATLLESAPVMPLIRSLGYKVAFVLQDGATDDLIPWDDLDVLFIGGSTEWKLGETAREFTKQSILRGKAVHMGRVNSYKRLAYANEIGCTSADGTFLRFGPDRRLPEVLHWMYLLSRGQQLTLYEPT